MDWRPSPEGVRDNLYASAIWLFLGLLGTAMLTVWVYLYEVVPPPILVALAIGFYGFILLAINQTMALFRKGRESTLQKKLDEIEQRVGKLEGTKEPYVLPQVDVEEGRASLGDGEQGKLVIRYAGYGLGPGYELDITAQVQALVKNGELHVRVWPDDLGVRPDFYEGKPKTLRVRYSYNGKEVKEIARRDMQVLHIPQRDQE